MTQHAALEPPRPRGSAILAVAACALLWSTGGLFVKLIEWNPFAIAGVRSLISQPPTLEELFLRHYNSSNGPHEHSQKKASMR